jgi:hypothetical protein
MKTTFVLTLDPDVAEYIDLKTQGRHNDPNQFINQLVLEEKRKQEQQGLWPPKASNQPGQPASVRNASYPPTPEPNLR